MASLTGELSFEFAPMCFMWMIVHVWPQGDETKTIEGAVGVCLVLRNCFNVWIWDGCVSSFVVTLFHLNLFNSVFLT